MRRTLTRLSASRIAAPVLVTAALGLGVAGMRMDAAPPDPKPMLTTAFPPTSVMVGSAQTLTFAFTAIETAHGTVSIRVPPAASGSPWTPPQALNPGAGGWVTTTEGNCNSAAQPVVDADQQTILVTFRCAKNKSFSVTYGAGAAKAIAATSAGATTFTTLVNTGRAFVPTTLQPTVTLTPGPTARLTLDPTTATTAGDPVLLFVRSFDQYGNFTPGYRGTVTFSSTDPQALLPPEHTFTALENGSRGFIAEVRTAGSQWFTVDDTLGTIAGDALGPLAIGPGSPASVDPAVAVNADGVFPAWFGGTGLTQIGSCGALVADAFGNDVSSAELQWSSTDPHATLGSPTPGAIAFCNFVTVGPQTVTVTVEGFPEVAGTVVVDVVGGPVAHPDDITVPDPTHAYGMTVWPINVLHNDVQQRQSPHVYNPLLGFYNTLYSVTQPTYVDEETGTLYQVGVLGFSSDLHFLVWDLDPSGDVEAIVPGAVLKRCKADAMDGQVCRIDEPMVATYVITDSVNHSMSTLTLHLVTPDTVMTPSVASTLTPDNAPITVTSNASTTATLSTTSGVIVPLIQLLQVVTTAGPAPPPDGESVPAGAVHIGLQWNVVTDDCSGPPEACVVGTNVTPGHIVVPSGTESLFAGGSDSVSGAYSFPGPPLTTERTVQGNVLIESPLQDIWRGDGTCLTCTSYPWLVVQGELSPPGMVPVQITVANEDPSVQYAILAVFFNITATHCHDPAGNVIGCPVP